MLRSRVQIFTFHKINLTNIKYDILVVTVTDLSQGVVFFYSDRCYIVSLAEIVGFITLILVRCYTKNP